MQYLNLSKHLSFIQSQTFFQYHGLVLSFLWIFAATFGIFLKRVNLYLHAFAFFLIDLTTLYFVTGAWIRVYPHISTFSQWSTLKQCHIIGGTIFSLLLISQHLLGAKTLLSKSRKSRTHVVLAWVVTNLARVLAYFGWTIGHYKNKQEMVSYVLYASILLFIISTGSVFLGWGKPKSKVEEGKSKEN